MTTYKGVKGIGIQSVDADAIASQILGGSWASGGDLNTTRALGLGAGTQTAALMASGYTSPPYSAKNEVELYNGTSWTETTEVNTARSGFMGGGTQTSAIGASGSTAETWNGSAWTEVSELNTTRSGGGGVGQSSTAAFAFGGYVGPPRTAVAELWNGSSWTEVGDLNTAGDEQASVGITTSALCVGGTPMTAKNESWDGSSWTEVADINTPRSGATGSGDSNTVGIVFAGYNPGSSNGLAVTESWDGSSWTEVSDLSTARKNGTPAGYPGGQNAALMIAGIITAQVATTEEWTAPTTFRQLNLGDIYFNADPSSGVLKYTGYGTGAWASGGALPAANRSMATFGTQSSAIAGGGNTPGDSATQAYSYDGTSWTEIAELNATKNEGVGFGNSATSGYLNRGTNENWNGSSWTETTDLNTTRFLASASGHLQQVY